VAGERLRMTQRECVVACRHAGVPVPGFPAVTCGAEGPGPWRPVLTYVKAPMPVMARPTMSVCMVSVPSNVWIASRSTMCRMTW
jgi:hypothetical protein